MHLKEKGRREGDPIPKVYVCQDNSESSLSHLHLQAPPDNRGEDDWTYFRRRPGAAVRTRLPFPNEFPDDFMEYGGGVAFVRITVERDAATGEPTRGARSLMFCEGGNA